MNVDIAKENARLIAAVSGKVDTVTAPQLEEEIAKVWEGSTELVLDFREVTYVSSAGLRVLLRLHKHMDKLGGMKVKNINSDVMEVLSITGFSDILHIE